jgi:hypothetical protein
MMEKMASAVRAIKADKCGLYRPGHQVHQIQVRLAREGTRQQGRAVGVDQEGWIQVEVGGSIERFWHHDSERAQEALDAGNGVVEVSGKGLLMVMQKDGSAYCLCVSKTGATPCVGLDSVMAAIQASRQSAQDLEVVN